MAGARGAVVSIVTAKAPDTALVIPANVLNPVPVYPAVAVKLWLPSASAAVTKLQAPPLSAVALPSSVAPS